MIRLILAKRNVIPFKSWFFFLFKLVNLNVKKNYTQINNIRGTKCVKKNHTIVDEVRALHCNDIFYFSVSKSIRIQATSRIHIYIYEFKVTLCHIKYSCTNTNTNARTTRWYGIWNALRKYTTNEQNEWWLIALLYVSDIWNILQYIFKCTIWPNGKGETIQIC